MAGRARPDWFYKYACKGCGAGYIECAQGLMMNLKCCADCEHPERWTTKPAFTDNEIDEMWAAKGLPTPDYVLEQRRAKA